MSLEGKRTPKSVSGRLRAPLPGWRKFMLPGRAVPILAGVLVVAALFLSPAPAHAQWRLIGCDYEGWLYDINPATGGTSNPRYTGVPVLAGIAYSPADDTLYGMTTFGGDYDLSNRLYRLDYASGASTMIGQVGFRVGEGDLAWDPTSGKLYGTNGVFSLPNVNVLFRIDSLTGLGTTVGNVLPELRNISGMAFSSSGHLFLLDTLNNTVVQVDKSSGSVVEEYGTGFLMGPVAGMAISPGYQFAYLADGEKDATDKLFLLDLDTHVVTEIGDLGLPNGLSGLAFVVPEPGTAMFLLVLTLAIVRNKGTRGVKERGVQK